MTLREPHQVAVEQPQVAQIIGQDPRAIAGAIHHLFVVASLHAKTPRSITRAEFFEPKPMQLQSAISIDFAML